MMNKIIINEENIFLNKKFTDQKEYFDYIFNSLYERGIVKKNYFKSIVRREAQFPTGLDTGEIKIAIPHTDFQVSKGTAIIITVLERPLLFSKMDNPVEKIKVDIIVQIVFDSPEKQPELLKKLMKLVSDQENLYLLKNCKNKKEVIELFNNFY